MNKSILLSGIMIAAAILLNGHLERKAEPGDAARLNESEIEASFVESFEYALHGRTGDNVIMGKEREVEAIKVDDIRFSDDTTAILVEFSLSCADGVHISSAVRLNRDEFGTYRGAWDFGAKKAHFQFKTNNS